MDIRNWKRFLPPKEDKKKWRTFICVAIGLKLIVKVALIASALWLGQSMHKSAAGRAESVTNQARDNSSAIRANRGLELLQAKRQSKNSQDVMLAGLKVAMWLPTDGATKHPLVIFSHGFHGTYRQSESITRALADAGYLVVSVNHADALGRGMRKSDPPFKNPGAWSESSYAARRDDVVKMLAALKSDERWKESIDWSKVGLVGHSLGGYTVLGLAGAWPSWKLPDVKAVVALSPYVKPYLDQHTLENLNVPVMYQTGTADLAIKPYVVGPHGSFQNSSSPAELVVITGANHFTWSNINLHKSRAAVINHYCVAFLDKYVKGDVNAAPETKIAGVSELEFKHSSANRVRDAL